MKRPLFSVGTILLSLLTTSCQTTQPMTRVETLWKDPHYTPGRFHRALVIGVFQDLDHRKLFEQEFARQLRPHGENATPSYKYLPLIGTVERAQVESLVKKQQMDLVFITRIIDRKTVQAEVPGYVTYVQETPLDGAVSYLEEGRQTVIVPGYVVDQRVAVLETKVFDTRTGACVWLCRSDTLADGFLEDLIRGYARIMTQALYAPGSVPSTAP